MNFIKRALFAAGLTTSLLSCEILNYESIHEKKLMSKNFTKEQAEVLTAVSLRQMLTDAVQEEDSISYKLNYGGITDEDILKTVEGIHKSTEETLETGKTLANSKYFTNTDFGANLEKQEKVFNYLEDMISRKILHKKFNTLLQNRWDYDRYDPFNTQQEDKYSLSTIFPFKNDKMEFDAEYVKTARKAKKLSNPENIVEDLTEYYQYLEKVDNPEYPIKDKNKKQIYKKRKTSLRILSYNLDNDPDMEADYLEVYRIDLKGKSESKPAIRIFKPNGVGNLEVVLADKDMEGTPGFGMPDMVEKYINITKGSDIYSTNNLINYIFGQIKKDNTKPDFNDINKVYIARTGTLITGKYDIKETGWEQELPDYRSSGNDRMFSIHIKLTGSDDEKKHDKNRKIDWIAKKYSDPSRVVEFYKPVDRFKDKGYSSVTATGKILSLVRTDGAVEQYDVGALTADRPYRIDFDRNRQKRWVILDQDGDRKHYESKREITWPDDVLPKK